MIGLYGQPSHDLLPIISTARQFSPLIPGSARLEDCADGSLSAIAVLAPASVLERRYVLAHALRGLCADGVLTALAPNERGGMRLAKELAAFGCVVDEASRRHHRICTAPRPERFLGIDDAIAAGDRRIAPDLGLWSQPGVFSWDRPDPGSLALIRQLPQLAGAGADMGCGIGLLSRAVLASPAVTRLLLIDIDRRAIDASQLNIADNRATFLWADARNDREEMRGLDFVIMNPPFHDGGMEDRALGQAFIRQAAASLKAGGVCWMVANRHLPYEVHLKTMFATFRLAEQSGGYKIYEARR